MSKEKQIEIEVITYEQDRLNFFTDLMQKAQKHYKQLFKLYKDAPYLSEETQVLSDAGRKTHFYGDVVEMLEKGYCKQSEGEWTYGVDREGTMKCTLCRRRMPKIDNARYRPNCGAKMKGE